MDDGPNRGQPTDRVQIGWDLAAPATLDGGESARPARPAATVPMSMR